MKIAFVLSEDPAGSGGGVREYVKNLALELLKQKVNVAMITPKQITNSPFHYLRVGKPGEWNVFFLLRLILKVPFISLPEDMIICANRADFLFPFVLFKRKNCIGVIIHGKQFLGVKARGRIIYAVYAFIERYVLKRADFVFFVGRQSEKDYAGVHQFLKRSFTAVIPTGAPNKKFRLMNKEACRSRLALSLNKKIIVTVCRLGKEKRLGLAIEAFHEASSVLPNTIFIIIGDGQELRRLKNKVSELGLEDKVKFIGFVENSNIPYYLNAADLFLLTSERENGPIVTKEALACGIPVVSSAVGDVEEYLNKRSGIVVRSNKPNDYAKEIVEALERKWDKAEIAKLAQRFDSDELVERFLTQLGKVRQKTRKR